MSISSEITRLQTAKSDIASAITAKGGTVNAGDGFSDFATAIGTITGGGGSLPSSITAIDGGSFTPASDTASNGYSIYHALGVVPRFAIIHTDDLTAYTTGANGYIIEVILSVLTYATSGTVSKGLNKYYTRRSTDGSVSQYAGQVAPEYVSGNANANYVDFGISFFYYKSGATYKWYVEY
jgi:hypothetical protein